MVHDTMEGQVCRTERVVRRDEACRFCEEWNLHWVQQVLERDWAGVLQSHEAIEHHALYLSMTCGTCCFWYCNLSIGAADLGLANSMCVHCLSATLSTAFLSFAHSHNRALPRLVSLLSFPFLSFLCLSLPCLSLPCLLFSLSSSFTGHLIQDSILRSKLFIHLTRDI